MITNVLIDHHRRLHLDWNVHAELSRGRSNEYEEGSYPARSPGNVDKTIDALIRCRPRIVDAWTDRNIVANPAEKLGIEEIRYGSN
jgi:hypothetical protein